MRGAKQRPSRTSVCGPTPASSANIEGIAYGVALSARGLAEVATGQELLPQQDENHEVLHEAGELCVRGA